MTSRKPKGLTPSSLPSCWPEHLRHLSRELRVLFWFSFGWPIRFFCKMGLLEFLCNLATTLHSSAEPYCESLDPMTTQHLGLGLNSEPDGAIDWQHSCLCADPCTHTRCATGRWAESPEAPRLPMCLRTPPRALERTLLAPARLLVPLFLAQSANTWRSGLVLLFHVRQPIIRRTGGCILLHHRKTLGLRLFLLS